MIFHKRVWALVGILYVIIANVLVYYAVFHSGELLSGIPGLMVLPAILGVMASVLANRKKEEYSSISNWKILALLLGCAVLFVLCLLLGLRQLLGGIA